MIREDMYGRVQVSVTVVKRKLDMERNARYGMRGNSGRLMQIRTGCSGWG